MTDAKQGAYPFNADLQMLTHNACPELDKIYSKLSQGIRLRGSQYVTLTAVSKDDTEDWDKLKDSVKNLGSELEALIPKIYPPMSVFPSAPGNPI